MDLMDFQTKASENITNRCAEYNKEPLFKTKNQLVPFYQNLSAITGSGKTLILADAIEQIRASLSTEPVVLWLSKGKVVVWQTYDNLSTGKYSENIPNYEVKPLLDCKERDLQDDKKGLLLIATVGKINQKDKEAGDRRIFQTGFDNADSSLWQMLKNRISFAGKKRDLIIVYLIFR